jgi:hypothetical protein
MPDHRFMYPKVVPVVHNFAIGNLRNSIQVSKAAVDQPKSTTDFVKSDGGHYRGASVR